MAGDISWAICKSLLWPNGWIDQDGTWHGGRPWSSPHCARWGHSYPPQRGGRAPPIFRPIFIVAGCIKMPLGMEVGLSIGDFVLDGDPAPAPKGAEPHPIFGPRLLWPNGCMDQDATWYGGNTKTRKRHIGPYKLSPHCSHQLCCKVMEHMQGCQLQIWFNAKRTFI